MSDTLLEIAHGRVMHARLSPFVHHFAYRIFCMRYRIDRFNELKQFNSWLFGVDRSRLVSFQSRDHGARDGSDLMSWLHTRLLDASIALTVGAVWLQCFPRVLGYVFNPVSFWFVHDQQGVLRAILAEVNNTFGQRHQYLLVAPDRQAINENSELECAKVFHVSPFFAVSGRYKFKLQRIGQADRVAIDYFDPADGARPVLITALLTKSAPYSTQRLVNMLMTMPMMTFGVMLRIHWQAFKLWRKGAKYHAVPALPDQETTDNAGISQ